MSGAIALSSGATSAGAGGEVLIGIGGATRLASVMLSLTVDTSAMGTGGTLTVAAGTGVTDVPVSMEAGTGTTSTGEVGSLAELSAHRQPAPPPPDWGRESVSEFETERWSLRRGAG